MHTWCQYNVRTAVKENKCIKCVRKHKWVATLVSIYLFLGSQVPTRVLLKCFAKLLAER